MSLFKRGGVYWSYVWVDGVRHARSTDTGNRRLAEQIDQKHKEEVRLRATQFPELKPQMKFAELAGRFLDEGRDGDQRAAFTDRANRVRFTEIASPCGRWFRP